MNWIGFFTIYKKEMIRTFRVPLQTILSPVITTSLYFVVFGNAIGSRISVGGDVSYAQFIVPGLIMMSLLSSSLSASSSGIFAPKFTGTIYELFSAPLSYLEITLGYTLAASTRAMIISAIIYIVSLFFTPVPVAHPLVALLFIFLTAFTFAMFGFIIGLLSDTFEKLNVFPTFVITPLSFLGGVFYSVDMLPGIWHKISYINPIVYMINGLRWSFFENSTVTPLVSIGIISIFLAFCLIVLWRIFKTGYRIKS